MIYFSLSVVVISRHLTHVSSINSVWLVPVIDHHVSTTSQPCHRYIYIYIWIYVCYMYMYGVGMRHPVGPKIPDGLNLGIHIFVYVYKLRMCIYLLRGGMRSWTNCFFSFNKSFLFRKVEDVTTISKSQSLTSVVSIKDCTLRVPNTTTTLFLYEQ